MTRECSERSLAGRLTASIDSGTLTGAPATDYAGVPRPLDGDGNGLPAVDMGAFEFVHTTADTDGDGMPDAWETSQGLDATVANGGEDSDGDRASNYAEFMAGTSPRDPSSTFRVSLTRLPGGTVLSLKWASVAGHTYGVRVAGDPLPPAPRPALGSNLIGTGGILEVTDPLVTTTNRYYRVEVSPP